MHDKISVSERKSLEKRIHEKFKLVKQSTSSEQIKVEQIKAALLAERGVHIPSAEIAQQFKDLIRQREELVEPHLLDAKNDLRVKIAELENSKKEEMEEAQRIYMLAVTAAKSALSARKTEVDNRFAATERELRNSLDGIRETVLKIHAADISQRLDDLKKMEMKTSEIERVIEVEAKTRTHFLQRQAGRITQIIDDAENRILEQLMFVVERSEAKKLLDGVPTVAYVFEMLSKGPEGYSALVQQLNPEAASVLKNSPLLLGSSNPEPTAVDATVEKEEKKEEGTQADPYVTVQVGSVMEQDDESVASAGR